MKTLTTAITLFAGLPLVDAAAYQAERGKYEAMVQYLKSLK